MRHFAALFDAIDRTTSTNAKVAAMVSYFAEAPREDAAWAVFFLTGRRLKRLVPSAAIQEWTLATTGLPSWLLHECWSVVGDGAEIAALVLDQVPAAPSEDLPLSRWVEERIIPLKNLSPELQQARVTDWWRRLDRLQRFMLLKLLTGEFRVGVSQTLVVRAIAQAAGLPATTIAARLMGEWTPSAEWFSSVLSHERTDDDRSRPYPFCLASPLDVAPETLGSPDEWLIEWKWDGIRAQLVKRDGRVHLWSRGEELITHRFPEIAAAATNLPDGTVLDGEVLAFRDDRPMPFSALQQRIGRQKQVAQLVRAVPVVFMTYDLLRGTRRRHQANHAARAPRTAGRVAQGLVVAALACRDSRHVARAGSAARRVTRSWGGRADAEAVDLRLRRRPEAWRLVEVEDRAVLHRRGPHLRAAGQRQARQPADRLHVRRVGPW